MVRWDRRNSLRFSQWHFCGNSQLSIWISNCGGCSPAQFDSLTITRTSIRFRYSRCCAENILPKFSPRSCDKQRARDPQEQRHHQSSSTRFTRLETQRVVDGFRCTVHFWSNQSAGTFARMERWFSLQRFGPQNSNHPSFDCDISGNRDHCNGWIGMDWTLALAWSDALRRSDLSLCSISSLYVSCEHHAEVRYANG